MEYNPHVGFVVIATNTIRPDARETITTEHATNTNTHLIVAKNAAHPFVMIDPLKREIILPVLMSIFYLMIVSFNAMEIKKGSCNDYESS